MAKQSALIKRQREAEDRMFQAGKRIGLQKMADMMVIALNDPAVMGKGVLGYERLSKVLTAADELMEKYAEAFDPRLPEADVAQEKLDDRLRKIVGGKTFHDFNQRYPELQKCKY